MKIEYRITCSEAEKTLLGLGIGIPVTWMVEFLLDFSESGYLDPDDLQDLAAQIRSELDDLLKGEEA